LEGTDVFEMSFGAEWKGIFSAECVENVSPRWRTVHMGILNCMRFGLVEFLVLVCLVH